MAFDPSRNAKPPSRLPRNRFAAWPPCRRIFLPRPAGGSPSRFVPEAIRDAKAPRRLSVLVAQARGSPFRAIEERIYQEKWSRAFTRGGSSGRSPHWDRGIHPPTWSVAHSSPGKGANFSFVWMRMNHVRPLQRPFRLGPPAPLPYKRIMSTRAEPRASGSPFTVMPDRSGITPQTRLVG